MEESEVKTFLREHPRLLSALFGLTVLLSQMGTVAAGNGSAISGP